MLTKTVSALLFIRLVGPPLSRFDLTRYVDSWLLKGRRSDRETERRWEGGGSDRQTHRQINRLTDGQTHKERQTGKHTDTDRQTEGGREGGKEGGKVRNKILAMALLQSWIFVNLLDVEINGLNFGL